MNAPRDLIAEPLTAVAFAPYGEVLEAPTGSDDASYEINAGTATRHDDVAEIDVESANGVLRVSVARAAPRAVPVLVEALERHPLGSQAFVPLDGGRFLAVVAAGREAPRAVDVRAFVAGPGQGVNYRRGVWHFPLSALDRRSDFVVLDRRGPVDEDPDDNLEWGSLDRPVRVALGR